MSTITSKALPIAASIVAIATPGAGRAETAELEPSRDNTLYESASGSTSNGAGGAIFVGRTNQSGNYRRRALLHFDVDAVLPAGATIDSVTLSLEMNRSSSDAAATVTLYLAESDWGEGASDAGPSACGSGGGGGGTTAASGDATWLHTFYSTDLWTTEGGDYDDSAPRASTDVGGVGSYTWGSSSDMVADVQDWLDNPSTNYGWILVGDESTTGSAKRFESREAPCGAPPVLTVDFTPPSGTGACCFDDGTCLIRSSSDCAAAGGTYAGDGTSCASDCTVPTGACCMLDFSCSEETEDDCAALGGYYGGDGSTCVPGFCADSTGACCFSGAGCLDVNQTDCAILGGAYQGIGTTCSPNPCPLALAPFVDELPLPSVATPTSGTPGGSATYDLQIREFDQELHRDLTPTRVWGYGGTFPGPTIEARTGEPVTVRWINNLRDETGTLRTDHYLPVDLCPHGADDGPPRTVVHLHGGHTPAAFDGNPEDTVTPEPGLSGYNDYTYPNNQPACTLWYHDHALGITRLNVYMGLAGFYLIRDDDEDALGLPDGDYEVPLVIQDRSFNQDGTLDYPADLQDHFFGDYILVNGKVWPYLSVDQGLYRFRVLNGSNSRVYTLTIQDDVGDPVVFAQIGSDGGLLRQSVPVVELTLGPGERADLLVSFAPFSEGDELLLVNSAPAPFPGEEGVGVVPDVMKFVVTGNAGFTGTVPTDLRTIPALDPADSAQVRELVLQKESDDCADGLWMINGLRYEDLTEFPVIGTTETWQFVNNSGVMHPMHIHLDFFQIIRRQAFEMVDGEIVPTGPVILPDPNERGWKDTARANPNEILTVVAQFEDYTGRYMYHCHILEHEDHEMMRQFEVVPPCPDGNGDGVVDTIDFLGMLAAWGSADPTYDIAPDGGDGTVDTVDFLTLLALWGPCPGE